MKPSPQCSSQWFDYPVHVQPCHTDYAGVVWHGSYIEWMEAARIATFRSVGLEYSSIVQLGCDLPVIDLSLRYSIAVRMGDQVTVKTRISKLDRVKLHWDQDIICSHHQKPCVVGRVTLVPVNTENGRILRTLPQVLQNAIEQLMG